MVPRQVEEKVELKERLLAVKKAGMLVARMVATKIAPMVCHWGMKKAQSMGSGTAPRLALKMGS